MKLSKAVSLRIREILAKKGITQYKLEQKAGITHNTLLCIMSSRYESCNLKTLMKIINALEISAAEFFDSEYFLDYLDAD